MPISARKSSLAGLKRGPQKYIPYRADDLQHGKRTGIAVEYVDRNSDEFEPFEALIKQADLRTPPKPKMHNKKKRGANKAPIAPQPEDEYDDEYGEMSMEEDSACCRSCKPTCSNIASLHHLRCLYMRIYAFRFPKYSNSVQPPDKRPHPQLTARRILFSQALPPLRSRLRADPLPTQVLPLRAPVLCQTLAHLPGDLSTAGLV